MSVRFKNRFIAKLLTSFPFLASLSAKKLSKPPSLLAKTPIPWTPLSKSIKKLRVALITTAGVHLKKDKPFDMYDPEGDATFRVIPFDAKTEDLTITHDYYDHSEADKDVNIVLPLERIREVCEEGVIGQVASKHYGFMGHIEGELTSKLLKESAPKVAALLKIDGVDAVILSPG